MNNYNNTKWSVGHVFCPIWNAVVILLKLNISRCNDLKDIITRAVLQKEKQLSIILMKTYNEIN
jgi:hypothetical protein